MDKKIEKKNWTLKKVLTISFAGLFIVFFIYTFLFADTRSKLNVDSERITIAEVKKGSFQEFIPINGVVQPIKTILIPAIEGGTVESKYMEGGTQVNKGDTIIKLANNRLIMDFMHQQTLMYDLINNLQNTKLRLQQNNFTLKKSLKSLDFELDAARDLYERNKKLYEEKVIAEQDYLKFKRDYDKLANQREIEAESQSFEIKNAQNQVAQLQSTILRTSRNMEMMEDNLKNLYIKAPISGQLSAVQVELGSPIAAGQIIGQIDDIKGFKVRASIDEHYLSRVFAGLRGEFEFAGKTYPLEITLVYQEVKENKFQVDMHFLKETPEGLRRGQTLQIRLALSDATTALLIPRGGFNQTTGGNWIFVVNESGDYAIRRDIKLGRQNQEYYEVMEGLKPGEKVIVSSYDNYEKMEKLVLKD